MKIKMWGDFLSGAAARTGDFTRKRAITRIGK